MYDNVKRWPLVCLLSLTPACEGSDSETPAEDPGPQAAVAAELPAYPEAISSFGAALLDGHLYVYSGHIGETHSHSRDNLSQAFRRLDLASGDWTALAMDDPTQSNALVAHGGQIVRIGGMSAANAIGDSEVLLSRNHAQRYDPAADAWTALPALPQGRSSHEAVVVGDSLYVVGGWLLTGGDSASGTFHDTWLRRDLNDDAAEWESHSQPFRRRAVCAAEADGLIYVIGGLDDETGQGSLDVDILDTTTDTWSEGPALPAGEPADVWNAFGCSAFGVGGAAYATTRDGFIHRIRPGESAWTTVGSHLTPRFFLRLVPGGDDHLLLVGGADINGDHLADIERFDL